MPDVNEILRGLDPGTRYVVRVRSISKLGVKSSWSEAFEFVTPNDGSVPGAPDNLSIDFTTPDLVLNWDAPDTNEDGTILNDLNKYRVVLDSGGAGAVSYETTTSFFVYSFVQNDTDFSAPQPAFDVRVFAVDATDNISAPIVGAANNVEPNTPVDPPTLQAASSTIAILMSPHPDDKDVGGFIVEHSLDGVNFSDLATVDNASFTHNVSPGSQHYYRFRVYDVFNQESGSSPSASVSTSVVPVIDDPPAAPTSFSGTGGYNESDGAFIDLQWDPNQELDLNRYEIQYIQDGVGFVPHIEIVDPQETTYHLTGLEADTTYRLVLYARDNYGKRSDPSSEITVATDPDTTTISEPLNARAHPSVRSLVVRWDSHDASNFAAYELYASQTSGFTPDSSNRIFKGVSTFHVHTVGRNETWYYKLRAEDQNDNFSNYTNEFSGTSLNVDSGQDVVTDNIHANGGLIGGISLSPEELSGGRIRGSEFVVDAAGQLRFQASGSVVWEPGAEGGIELSEDGYVNNSDYRNDNTTGFNLDNNGLVINDGFVSSRALRIGATLSNLLRHSGFDEEGMVDGNGNLTGGTFWEHHSGSADYQDSNTVRFIGGSLEIANTTNAEIRQDVSLFETLTTNEDFAGSVWARAVTGTSDVRVIVVDVDNSESYFSTVHTVGTQFTRVTSVWSSLHDTNNLRFIIETDNDVIVDGAMLSKTSSAIPWEPAPLELPQNYISNVHINDMSVSKLISGTMAGQEIILDDLNNDDARIANTAGTFEITQDGATFQDGTISLIGGNGAVTIDSDSLRVDAGSSTQLLADDSGLFIGGTTANDATIYMDTTDDRVIFQGSDTGYSFTIDPGATNVLELQDGSGFESFYLTNQGEAWFQKGIIGLDNDGTGGFHVNQAGDMWVGNALRDSAPFVIFANGNVELDASEITLFGSNSIIRQSNDNWWIRGDGQAYFGSSATFEGDLNAASGTFTGNLEAAGVVVGNPSGSWHGISLNWASDIFVKDDTGRVLLRAEDSGGTRILDFDSDASTPLVIGGGAQFEGTISADNGDIGGIQITSSAIEGNYSPGTGGFQLHNNGILEAHDVFVRGTIDNSSGSFGVLIDDDSVRLFDSGVERGRLGASSTLSGAIWLVHSNDSTAIQIVDGTIHLQSFIVEAATDLLQVDGDLNVTNNAEVDGDLNVIGNKDASIADPDDDQVRYHFSAVEVDSGGAIEHEAEVEANEPHTLPDHWQRIARRLRVISVQPLDGQQGRIRPVIDGWTVTVEGPTGRYWVLCRADRADPGVEGWEHVRQID